LYVWEHENFWLYLVALVIFVILTGFLSLIYYSEYLWARG
jgi:hypothetical protein